MFYGKSEWGRRKQLHFLQDPGGLPSRAEAKQVHMKWTKQMRNAPTMPFIHPKTTTSSTHCETNACTNAEMEVSIPGHPLSNIAASTQFFLQLQSVRKKDTYVEGKVLSPRPKCLFNHWQSTIPLRTATRQWAIRPLHTQSKRLWWTNIFSQFFPINEHSNIQHYLFANLPQLQWADDPSQGKISFCQIWVHRVL